MAATYLYIQSYTVLFLTIYTAAVRRKSWQANVQDHQQPRSQGLSSYHPSGCESGSNPDHASFSSSRARKSTSQISGGFFYLKPSNKVFHDDSEFRYIRAIVRSCEENINDIGDKIIYTFCVFLVRALMCRY